MVMDSANTLLAVSLPLLFLLAVVLGNLKKRVSLHKIQANITVIAGYEAPQLLSPAELGYIVDKSFGENELLATLISLVQKDYLRAVKHEAGNPLFSTTDKPAGEDLDYADKAVLGWLNHKDTGPPDWKTLSNSLSDAAGVRSGFEHEVRQQLVEKGYIDSYSAISLRARSSRGASWLAFAAAVVCTVVLLLRGYDTDSLSGGFRAVQNVALVLAGITGAVILWAGLMVLFQLLRLIYRKSAGYPAQATDLYKQKWPAVAGFQLFVRTAEFSRLEADANIMDAAMPYAVGLGFRPDMDKMMENNTRNN